MENVLGNSLQTSSETSDPVDCDSACSRHVTCQATTLRTIAFCLQLYCTHKMCTVLHGVSSSAISFYAG